MLPSAPTFPTALSCYNLFTTVRDELDHISVWAATNNLRLNAKKSRELILHRRRGLVPPASIPDVERVSIMKVFGVTLRDDLNASTHITGVLEACSRSLCTPDTKVPRSSTKG